MAHKIGINWYSRLQQKIAHLEHQIEVKGQLHPLQLPQWVISP